MKKKIDIALIIVGLIGMVTLAIIAIIDSNAGDIGSAIIVQLLFAALFVSGYISFNRQKGQ